MLVFDFVFVGGSFIPWFPLPFFECCGTTCSLIGNPSVVMPSVATSVRNGNKLEVVC